MPFGLVAAAVAVFADRYLATRAKPRDQREHSGPTQEEQQIAGVNKHTELHRSLDLRATVFLLVFPTFMAAAIKDGRGLFPHWLMGAMATTAVLGAVLCAGCLYARSKGIFQEKTVDHELKIMCRITRRKTWAHNGAVLLVVVEAALYGLGMWF